MRIEAVSIPQIQSAVQRPDASGVPDQLQPGTRVQAQVLSREGDTVQLRLEGGAELTARLEGGAFLAPGQEVRLLVTGRDEQSVTLSLERGGPPPGDSPAAGAQSEAAQILSSLRLPVTDSIVRRMENLLRNHPSLPADRAAFLAANEIEDPGLVRAAVRMMEQGATTGRMLEQLLRLLPQPPAEGRPILPEQMPQNPPQPGGPVEPPPTGGAPVAADGPPADGSLAHHPAEPAQAAPLAGASPGEPPQAHPAQELPQQQAVRGAPAEQLLRQALDQAVAQRRDPPTAPAPQTQAGQSAPAAELPPSAPAAPVDWVELLAQLLGAQADGLPLGQAPEREPPGVTELPAPPRETGGGGPPQTLAADETAEPANDTQRVLSLLTQTPALRHLPERGLQQLSTLLEQVVPPLLREIQEAPDAASALRSALEGLFASLDREGDTARQLRQAREELYLKLSVIQDAVRRSNLSEKPALVAETQRLMYHVRAMGEIQQVVYLQVPLRMEDRQETAELYIFKNTKNGRSRIDPEDVQILLALDLQHMGHLESMLHIRGREVSLSMELETDEAVAFTRRETPKLHRMLDAAGFKLTDAKVARAAARTTPQGALQTLLRHERVRSGCDLTI